MKEGRGGEGAAEAEPNDGGLADGEEYEYYEEYVTETEGSIIEMRSSVAMAETVAAAAVSGEARASDAKVNDTMLVGQGSAIQVGDDGVIHNELGLASDDQS